METSDLVRTIMTTARRNFEAFGRVYHVVMFFQVDEENKKISMRETLEIDSVPHFLWPDAVAHTAARVGANVIVDVSEAWFAELAKGQLERELRETGDVKRAGERENRRECIVVHAVQRGHGMVYAMQANIERDSEGKGLVGEPMMIGDNPEAGREIAHIYIFSGLGAEWTG